MMANPDKPAEEQAWKRIRNDTNVPFMYTS